MAHDEIRLVRQQRGGIVLRAPRAEDGAAVWRLIRSCSPLDENSLYCNLLQCDHFNDTCVVAECSRTGDIVGWTSSYIIPETPAALFIWQVAVDRSMQGQGLGKRMLAHLLARDACATAELLKTTITEDNKASWGLFSSLAAAHGGELRHEPYFRKDAHFDGEHATEHMVTISLARQARKAA